MFDRIEPEARRSLVLTDEDVTFLRTWGPVTLEKDDLLFEICPTCASPIWMRTTSEGSGSTTAILGSCCGRCEGFRHRHPEVFGFVTTFAQASRFIQLRLPKKSVSET